MSLMFRHGRLVVLSISLALAACDTASNQDAPVAPIQPVAPLGDGTGTGDVAQLSLADSYAKVVNTVHFDTDSYAISPQAEGILQAQAGWLQANPVATITVEGHADERGTREYNLGLAERRANAAAGYLAALGVEASRLSTLSYGKERPVCGEGTSACWTENRRAVSALNPQ